MNELVGLISGDNLFKYSFTLGIVMIIFSMIYPVQKLYELNIEQINYLKELEISNLDHENFFDEYKSNSKEGDELLSIGKNYKGDIQKNKKLMKRYYIYSDKKDKLNKTLYQLMIKRFNNKSLESKLNLLEISVQYYNDISDYLLFFGIGFSIFGFSGWSYITFKSIRKSNIDQNS